MKKISFRAATIALASALAVCIHAQSPPSLKVGTRAPKIEASKWLKGTEVKELKKGEVYVVEFWATWCPPCIESIPHLTEIAKKYKGKAKVIGISIWENDAKQEKSEDAYMPKVEAFVKNMGSKMDYTVAADTWDNKVADAWMKAADRDGIPTSFIVNKEGVIAWIGHPRSGLEEALAKVIDGTFDIKEEARKQNVAKQKSAEDKTYHEKIVSTYKTGDMKKTVEEIDKFFAVRPAWEVNLGLQKFDCLLAYDEAGAYVYARRLKDVVYKDMPDVLNAVAWRIVDDETKKTNPDYKLALEICSDALAQLKKESFMMGMILDTQALSYYKLGQTNKAIECQTKAVNLARKFSNKDTAETVKEMEKRLEEFKAKKG